MRSVALQLGLIILFLGTGCNSDKADVSSDDVHQDNQTDAAPILGSTEHLGDVTQSDQVEEELEDTQTNSETSALDEAIETNSALESDEITNTDNTSELVTIIESVEIPVTPVTPDSLTPPEVSDTDRAAEVQEPTEVEDTRESDIDNPLNQESAENVLFPEYVTPTDVEQCSVEDVKRRIYWDMRDYYLYADQVPQLNLANYDSPESLINALRVFPDVYSSVQDADTQFALADEGQREGFEFWFSPANDGVVRFRHIWRGSSADQAGIKRGDEIIGLEDRPIEELSNNEIISIIFSPEMAPLSLTVRTGDDVPRTVQVSHEVYQWVTAGPVTLTALDENAGSPKIAYLPIDSFVAPTKNEFDTAIAQIVDTGGVDELIVDLRYNGGGDTNIAHYMASIVGGEKVQGREAYTNTWNNKYSSLMYTRNFDVLTQPLNLPRVIVLTTPFTASASELFINSLKPYMDVVVIGERSEGKPYSSGIIEYCGKTLNIMTVERTNSVGVSVAGGIQPDCLVEDNWETPASSVEDPHMKASIAYILDGSCN